MNVDKKNELERFRLFKIYFIELADFKTRRVQMFRKSLIELTELQIKHAKVCLNSTKIGLKLFIFRHKSSCSTTSFNKQNRSHKNSSSSFFFSKKKHKFYDLISMNKKYTLNLGVFVFFSVYSLFVILLVIIFYTLLGDNIFFLFK